MNLSSLIHKGEQGQLWYDELRQTMLKLHDLPSHRGVVIYDLLTSAAGDVRELRDKLADLESLPSNDPCWNVARNNNRLPVPLPDSGNLLWDLASAVNHSRTHGDILPGDGPGSRLLGEYVRHCFATVMTDLLEHTEPAELLLAPSTTMQHVVSSRRKTEWGCMDLWKAPFPRCWVEFNNPLIIGSASVSAAAFVSLPEINTCVGALVSKKSDKKVPFSTYATGICNGVSTAEAEGCFTSKEEDLYRGALGNLWDFVTSRNVTYRYCHRKPGRVRFLEGRYQHAQGAACVAPRRVVVLGLSREVQVSEPDEQSQGEAGTRLVDRVFVPGCFHRWVYCGTCGDVHRHDLIGQNCRKCGSKVGPRANIRVEKYWHAPHWKGPEDAPVANVVRVLKT